MSHGDRIVRPPTGFTTTAQTETSTFAGLADPARSLYGIQFHPEVVHTPAGREILRNFVIGIAGARPSWTPANFVETTVAEIRARVGDGKVICALSGGVDSAVAATLVHRAIGDQLTCIFVDHGLLRKRESELLRATFAEHFGMKLIMVDAGTDSSAASRASRTPRRSAASSATSSSASSRRRRPSWARSTS